MKEILTRINKKLPQLDHNSWVEHVLAYAKTFPLTYHKEGLSGPFVIEKIYEMTKGNAIMVTEVGQHQMWAAQYYKYSKPRTLLTSGGLGTMGYGLGAAIGGCIAARGRRTVLFTGDGSFGMNLNEMATAVSQELPITIVIFDNDVLGMVRQWQTIFYDCHYSQTILDRKTDFPALAKAFGADGYAVYTMEDLKKALDVADKSQGPVLIDCHIDMDEKVLPMIPPGRSIKDMIVEG